MTGWWVVGGAVIMAITIVSGLFALAPNALGLVGGSPLAFIVFIPGLLASLWLYGLVYVWPGQSGGNTYGPGPAHTDDIAAFEEEIMAQTRVETGTPVYRSPDGPTRFNREQPARVGPRVSFGHKSRQSRSVRE